jgi:hypothetical protein
LASYARSTVSHLERHEAIVWMQDTRHRESVFVWALASKNIASESPPSLAAKALHC